MAIDVIESTESRFALALMLVKALCPAAITDANMAAPGALIRFLLHHSYLQKQYISIHVRLTNFIYQVT